MSEITEMTDQQWEERFDGVGTYDIALGILNLEAENAELRRKVALNESQRNAAIEAEKRDASKALISLAGANFATPAEGYGYNSSWAISDLCRCIAELRKDKERLTAIRNLLADGVFVYKRSEDGPGLDVDEEATLGLLELALGDQDVEMEGK